MYAVIEAAGKQYRVELGTQLEIDRQDVEPGQTVTLDRVLLIADGDEVRIGQPTVAGATVALDVVRQDRGEKIVVFKYGPKTRRRVKQGHRQDLTVLRVSDISWGGRSAARDAEASEAAEQRAAADAAKEAAKRAAADQALAAKLAREAGAEAATDEDSPPDGTKAAPTDDTTRTTGTAKPPKAAPKPAAGTTRAAGKTAAPRKPASRTQAPTPEKKAPKRRTTKKDE